MRKITVALLSAMTGAAATYGVLQLCKSTQRDNMGKAYKFKSYYNMLNLWLAAKNSGKNLEEYFAENGYRTVALYGMGEMGVRLEEELRNSAIEIKYGIDKNGKSPFDTMPVYSMNDENLPEVDAIVVTAVFAFEEIKRQLEEKVQCPVLSLADVVEGV